MSKQQSNRKDRDGKTPVLDRQSDDDPETLGEPLKPMLDSVQQINRVLEILARLPLLRRYGGDESALEEARMILEWVKERL